MDFDYTQYFDLKNEKLKELFDKTKHVWEAVKLLRDFLSILELGNIESELSKQCTLVNTKKISIGKNCRIEPYSYIEGPCYIQDNCHISQGAYIRPFSILCKGARVGHCSEIKQSILLEEAKAPHFNYVGDSILGNRVNLGAGVVLANYKHSGLSIRVKQNSKYYETGLAKLGAIIGDDSSLGCNTVTNPGTLIVKKYNCKPLSVLSGIVE